MSPLAYRKAEGELAEAIEVVRQAGGKDMEMPPVEEVEPAYYAMKEMIGWEDPGGESNSLAQYAAICVVARKGGMPASAKFVTKDQCILSNRDVLATKYGVEIIAMDELLAMTGIK